MDLQRAGWLAELLGRILGGYDPQAGLRRLQQGMAPQGGAALVPAGRGAVAAGAARAVAMAGAPAPRRQALLHVDLEMRRSGLLYGSPRLPSRVTQGQRLDRAESLFLAVVASKAFLALDVARIYGRPFDGRQAEAEISALLAASAGQMEVADQLLDHLRLGDAVDTFLPRLQTPIERALLDRVAPVSGDPRFDLPLHNGLVYGEARIVGRLAVALHDGEGRWQELGRRLLYRVDRERAVLLKALLWLAKAVGIPKRELDPVVAKELRRMRLPRQQSRSLRASLEHAPSAEELGARVRGPGLRRFVLEQAFLATLLTGEEVPGLPSLWTAFGFSDREAASIEDDVAEHFFDPDELYDAFALRAAAQEASISLVDRMAREIVLNLGRVGQEVRETGELTQLLAKAAMGQKLDSDERARAREQLIDLAKVVPSLAILAAPGGTLIFAALLKVLPFNILPSSFQQRPERPAARRPRRSSRPS